MTKAERMFQMVEAFASSGMSKEKYAHKMGISTSTMHYWFKSYKERGIVKRSETEVGGAAREFVAAPAFVQVPFSQEQKQELGLGQIVIVLASGTRIEVR